jgi:hypothetical protein
MTNRDMAGLLGVDVKTLHNWKKNRPALYKKVMQGFRLEDALEEARRHYETLQKIAQADDESRASQAESAYLTKRKPNN